jgi:cystathionine gamma-lyase
MSPVVLNGHSDASTHLNGRLSWQGVKKAYVDGFGTRAIHVGSEPSSDTGAVIPSISLSTTYKQQGVGIHKVSTAYHFR